MCDEHDHGPNMAALQTYQTSFATGDLEKIMSVMVSPISEFDEETLFEFYCWQNHLLLLISDHLKDDNYIYTSSSQPGHNGIWETSVITKYLYLQL